MKLPLRYQGTCMIGLFTGKSLALRVTNNSELTCAVA